VRRVCLVLCTVAPIGAPASAHKRSVNDILCGDSCVAANKTCRIGAPSTLRVEQGTAAKAGAQRPRRTQ
jgi:hypothetical protein